MLVSERMRPMRTPPAGGLGGRFRRGPRGLGRLASEAGRRVLGLEELADDSGGDPMAKGGAGGAAASG